MSEYVAPALLIDGEWIIGGGRVEQPVINPATEEVIGRVTHANPADLDRALEAAERSFKTWRQVSPFERSKILRRAAQLLRDRSEHIAVQMVLEQGKVLTEAMGEVLNAADIFDWSAEEGRRTYGRIIPGRVPGQRLSVLLEPIGPVAAFTPWNFPFGIAARKISASLAAGCSCIIKAAEETPGSAVALARAVQDAGAPAGVLNLVFGVPSEVSSHLIASPIIRKITFTGSTAVGKLLARAASDNLTPTTLELGGHAPVIVFEDADVERAAEMSVAGKFFNAGQVCVSPTRFYVHESVHDRFVDRFVEVARNLKVGSGLTTGTQMGPTANPRRLEAMEQLVGDAEQRGGTVRTGGKRHGNQGFFWNPTVLTDVDDNADIMNQEPFGPVAMINRFASFDEAVQKANRLSYGLAAYGFTRSDQLARGISEAIESGSVAINSFQVSLPETPFGGVKESGYGLEGGIEGLQAYMNTKFVNQI